MSSFGDQFGVLLDNELPAVVRPNLVALCCTTLESLDERLLLRNQITILGGQDEVTLRLKRRFDCAYGSVVHCEIHGAHSRRQEESALSPPEIVKSSTESSR